MSDASTVPFNGQIDPRLTKLKRGGVSSFAFKVRESMQRRYYIKKEFKSDIRGFELNDKIVANQFAKEAGVKAAEVIGGPCRISEVSFDSPGVYVLKPRSSTNSWGIQFLDISDELALTDYTTKERVTMDSILAQGIEDMKKRRFKGECVIEKMVLPDSADLPRPDDLKFYSFHGKSVLALHKRVGGGKSTYAWYNADGEKVDCGKYNDRTMPDAKVPRDFIEAKLMSEKLSSLIPLPFMRIDFLMSDSGPVFGELTPHPGNFDRFDLKWDGALGQYWEEAEARMKLEIDRCMR